jgi:hypothetical protein
MSSIIGKRKCDENSDLSESDLKKSKAEDKSVSVDEADAWFRGFYNTHAMVDRGVVVYLSKSDAVPYDLDAENAKWETEKLEREECIRQDKLDDPTFDEATQADPLEPQPLTPAAFSMFIEVFEAYRELQQVSKFDDDTLRSILDDSKRRRSESEQDYRQRLARLQDTNAKMARTHLVAAVERLIQNEYGAAEIPIEYHPVLELMSGIGCLGNLAWLSDRDLVKMALAHGHASSQNRIDCAGAILKSQVRLLQEMVDKGYSITARGYCRIRGLLCDNKKTLGMPLVATEYPRFDPRHPAEVDPRDHMLYSDGDAGKGEAKADRQDRDGTKCRCDMVGQYVSYRDQNQGWTKAKVVASDSVNHQLTLELTLRTEPPQVVQYTEGCCHPTRVDDYDVYLA